jgi:hypothetical protein
MEQSSDRGSPRDDSTDRSDQRPAHRPAHRPNPPPANPPYHSSNPPPEQRPSRPSDRPEHWPDSWFAGPPYPEPRQLDPRDLEGHIPPRDPGPIPRWDAGEPPRESYPDRYDPNSYGPSDRRQTNQSSAYRSTVTGGRLESSFPRLAIDKIRFDRWGRGLGIWIMGSLVLAGLVLLLDPSRVISRWSGGDNSQCQEVVQPQSILSREQLVKLLAIPERSAKSKIRQILREPYCYLASLKIRAGVLSQREAYPLEFDTDMWLVILYEGEEYAGYRFSPR